MQVETMVTGLPFVEAVALAAKKGYSCRVIERDETKYPATQDVREDRLSLTLVNGKVTKAVIG